MNHSKLRLDLAIAALVLAALFFFVNRGPYRALRFSTTGDFSSVYAASRCWLHGADPYLRTSLQAELERAGAPPDIKRDQDVNPSVYLPSALLWTASLAWLPWYPANTLWCLLSLVLLAASLASILDCSPLTPRARWCVTAAALVFSPTYVGVYDGNPSVNAIALVSLAICRTLCKSGRGAGLLLGLAFCFKPQIALCGFCLLFLWRRWRSIFAAGAVFGVSLLAGILVVSSFGTQWQWWHHERQNIAASFQPGGQSDPTPESPVAWQMLNAQTLVSYVIRDRRACDLAVWFLAACLVGCFVLCRRRRYSGGQWQDVAFFSAWTLTLTYHRYYDAQLLLLTIPLVAELWRNDRRKTVLLLGACLLMLAFPTQSLFARKLAAEPATPSFPQIVLLRNQPAAVLAMAIVLALYGCRKRLPRRIDA